MSLVKPLQPADDKIAPHLEKPQWVVGIGAGAGGLEAIQLLFGAMPADARLAFIICRHVQSGLSDPLADLLCTQTAMPVIRAEDGMTLEAGRIHLVAPNARMILLKDRLVSFDKAVGDEANLAVSPIDALLHSLAASAGSAAIAVVLSGSEKDGLRGCASVRDHGGLVLTQHPNSTEFSDSPRRIINADLASAIATPGGIAALIRRHVDKSQMPNAAPCDGGSDDSAFEEISALLAARFAIDAQAYRPSLVAKRVRRRLGMSEAETLADYLSLLKQDNAELVALRDDLLIRVTTFFRDPEAFALLEREVIPVLIEPMSPDRPVRVWVPACATGEEAYSLAMLILDRAGRVGKTVNLEVIASDHHATALEQARSGRYNRDRLQNIPSSLTERFLSYDGDAVDVGPLLRRHVTFVDHDMLNAPPPDDIDLVSCRNLLIYLAAASSEKALVACREALKPGGFLFLGSSEQLGAHITGLDVVDSKARIYRKALPPPIDDAVTRLSLAHRRSPQEPILPKAMNDSRPPESQGSDLSAQQGDLSRVLVENQRLLESTIDTLLLSNDRLRRRNQSLRAENHRLLHAHAALDDIATMIAHDLKTPLRAIERLAGRLHVALSVSETNEDAVSLLQPMQGRLALLSKVVDDLLAYAREGPNDTSDLEPLDLGDLLREALTLIGLPRNVRVLIRPPSLRIITWRIPLACIFRNLLCQAIERIGDTSGIIRIEAQSTESRLDVTVVDNGQNGGDPPSDLGFAIVRQFLEAAGGQLTFEADTSGSGHQVRFIWPIETGPMSKPIQENVIANEDRTDANEG